MATRQEHLAWCKKRAMKYVDAGDYNSVVTSMLSDLGKHEETSSSASGILAQMGVIELLRGPTHESIARYIEGFN